MDRKKTYPKISSRRLHDQPFIISTQKIRSGAPKACAATCGSLNTRFRDRLLARLRGGKRLTAELLFQLEDILANKRHRRRFLSGLLSSSRVYPLVPHGYFLPL